MTTFQMIALGVLGLVLVGQFVLPNLKMPVKKPSTIRQIEQVIAIKETSSNPKVIDACSQLLQALMG